MDAICVKCKRDLPSLANSANSNKPDGKYNCTCGVTIPYSQGIYQFVQTDEFYEGKFTATREQKTKIKKIVKLFERWFSINGNEERMWKKAIEYILKEKNGVKLEVLDIGSGGGHSFLHQLGSVTAVDLSLSSLINAKNIYIDCYQADAQELPFHDETFDLVFSSHVLGHVPLEQKQAVIKEICRVTKKDGFSLHSIECEANNFIYAKAKKYPELYKKYFQDMYGHYGLEYPSLCKKRFRKERFEPIYEMSDYCKGVIRPAGSYKVFFGAKEYSEKEPLFLFLATVSNILSYNQPVSLFSGVLLYPFTVLNRLGGADGVDSVKFLYQKK